MPDSLYERLAKQADLSQSSVGQLVRDAVISKYFNPEEEELSQRRKAFAQIDKHKKKFGGIKDIDYKALINDGRRY